MGQWHSILIEGRYSGRSCLGCAWQWLAPWKIFEMFLIRIFEQSQPLSSLMSFASDCGRICHFLCIRQIKKYETGQPMHALENGAWLSPDLVGSAVK